MDKKLILALSESELCSAMIFDDIYAIEDLTERFKMLVAVLERANKLGITNEAEKMITIYEQEERTRKNALTLDCNANNKVKNTGGNFLKIIENDYTIAGKIIYNEFKNILEYRDGGNVRQWTDSDDAILKIHIEKDYGISSREKYKDAMRAYMASHSYNPLRDYVDSIEWDGKHRIEDFLHNWTRCGNSEYTRECSRLLFAGGIARLYSPGCKQEDIITLIGKQGCGKTTLVRWLALEDQYYDDLSEFKDDAAAQKMQGIWVCELGELAAVKKTDQESVKAFISRQNDRYRAPYGEHVTDHPRQTFFVATSNTQAFLNDKSGGRRFYPVICNCEAHILYSHEETIKKEIKQCWAEARALYLKGELKPFPNPHLLPIIKNAQEGAMEEDWIKDAVLEYLENSPKTCTMQVWHEALKNPEWLKPKQHEMRLISQILENTGEWKKSDKKERFGKYGITYTWRRICWNTNDDALNALFSEIVM